MTSTPTIDLQDLVRPLAVADFIEQHWLAERPLLSAPCAALRERLLAIEEIADVQLLLRKLDKLDRSVIILGQPKFRSRIRAADAYPFLRQGYNLYIRYIEEVSSEALTVAAELARQLGIAPAPRAIALEIFTAEAGATASGHYDHDINFQILLEGEKHWRVAPNHHIKNPIQAYHPALDADGRMRPFSEEAYAQDAAVPGELPAGAEELVATPGTVVFLPRGYWHETRSLSRCTSLNFVFKGDTWASAVANALRARMQGDPLARAYPAGILAGSPGLQRHARQSFEELRQRSIRALAELTLEEVALSWVAASWRWADDAEPRRIVERDGGHELLVPNALDAALPVAADIVPLLRDLVVFRGAFDWNHVIHVNRARLAGQVPAQATWNLLDDLVKLGLLEQPAPGG